MFHFVNLDLSLRKRYGIIQLKIFVNYTLVVGYRKMFVIKLILCLANAHPGI